MTMLSLLLLLLLLCGGGATALASGCRGWCWGVCRDQYIGLAIAGRGRGTAVSALVAEVSTTSSCVILIRSMSSGEEDRGYYSLQTAARTRSRGVSGELGGGLRRTEDRDMSPEPFTETDRGETKLCQQQSLVR